MTLAARIAIIGVIGTLFVGTTIVLSLPSAAEMQGEEDRPAPVRVAAVEAAPTHRSVLLHGVTRAEDRSAAAFTLGGRIQERSARVGASVTRGEVLARLDPQPLALRVSQARAQLAGLEARLKQVAADRARLQVLDAGQAVAPAELERLQSQETTLSASVEQARVGLDEALRAQREGVLRAPFDAEVLAVHAQAGETVGGGQPVFTLAGTGVELVVEAPESVWVGLESGATARVSLPGIGCTDQPASITQIARGASGPGGLFPIHLGLEPTQACRLASGLTAVAELNLPVPEALSVPVRAVVDPTGTRASVLRVRGDIVERVAVHPLRLHGDSVSVDGSLEIGDDIVTAGLVGLVDGQRVRVLP